MPRNGIEIVSGHVGTIIRTGLHGNMEGEHRPHGHLSFPKSCMRLLECTSSILLQLHADRLSNSDSYLEGLMVASVLRRFSHTRAIPLR